jgi:hypothetical protein
MQILFFPIFLSSLNNSNTAEDISRRQRESTLSEMRSNLEDVDSEAEVFSKP